MCAGKKCSSHLGVVCTVAIREAWGVDDPVASDCGLAHGLDAANAKAT